MEGAITRYAPPVSPVVYRDPNGYAPRIVLLREQAAPVGTIPTDSEEIDPFYDSLYMLPQYMGVNETLTKQQVLTIGAFIISQFPDLNMLEVVEAFFMVAAKKLYAPLEISQENASATQITAAKEGTLVLVSAIAWQNFSLPYAGRVLSAYKGQRQRETLAWAKATEGKRLRLAAPIEQTDYAPSEVVQWITDFTERTGEIPLYCQWDKAYAALEFDGEISLTKEAKADYLKAVKESKVTQAMATPNKARKLRDIVSDENIGSDCRKRLVITWLLTRYPNAKMTTPIQLPEVNLNQPTNGNTATETTIGHTDAISEDSNNAVQRIDARPAGRMDTQGKTTGDSTVPKPQQPAGQTKSRIRSRIATTGL